jgi:hypothetical protein
VRFRYLVPVKGFEKSMSGKEREEKGNEGIYMSPFQPTYIHRERVYVIKSLSTPHNHRTHTPSTQNNPYRKFVEFVLSHHDPLPHLL